jgi:7,8-dihydropterin-6-yl-methyl-4-(beta-D-ribofuranosyl)aminobenzene 5'-phosphate synthase
MRITTLVENTVNKSDLLAEHGLSLLLETEDEAILFDTGQNCALVHNVEKMGIDLSTVDKIVLSHGHRDHTGGLINALRACGGAQVYGHPGIFGEKYSKTRCEQRPIGMPYEKRSLELLGAELYLSQEAIQITEAIQTTGEVRRMMDFETIHERLCVIHNGTLEKDELFDDLSLIVSGEKGVAVILGCGHSGVINTLSQVREITNNAPISLIVGGIHLMDANADRIDRTMDQLKLFDIDKFALCHCTGMPAMMKLYDVFGDKVLSNNVGDQLVWD